MTDLETTPVGAMNEWCPDARCRNTGRDFFGRANTRSAAICRSCPCREVCLWTAMTLEDSAVWRFGTWGGATAADRGRIAALYGAPSVQRAQILARRWRVALNEWRAAA